MFSLLDPAKQCFKVVVLTYTRSSSVWTSSCPKSLRGQGFVSVWLTALFCHLDQCLAYSRCSIYTYWLPYEGEAISIPGVLFWLWHLLAV